MISQIFNSAGSVYRGAFAAAFAVALAIGLPAPAKAECTLEAAACETQAETFVNNLASRAIDILSQEDFTAEDREEAFRVLFTENLDIPRIGIFALGQYARTPTPEQKAEYFKLVEEFIVKVYASRLSDYTNQVFTILGSQPKGNRGTEVIISSRIDFTTGRESVPVEWWLLKTDDGFKVFDIKVVGIWMAQEQRSAFISVIRNNNGDFSALLDHIETRIGEASSEINTKLTEAGADSGA